MGRNVLGSATKGDTRVDNIVGYVNEKIQEAEKLEDKNLSGKESITLILLSKICWKMS